MHLSRRYINFSSGRWPQFCWHSHTRLRNRNYWRNTRISRCCNTPSNQPRLYFWERSSIGRHRNWHRSYDPSSARYLEKDPLGMVFAILLASWDVPRRQIVPPRLSSVFKATQEKLQGLVAQGVFQEGKALVKQITDAGGANDCTCQR